MQDSGAQQFHEPHPECWQSLMDVEGAAGNRNADELALAGHHTGAHTGVLQICWTLSGNIGRVFVPLDRCLRFGTCEGCVGEPRLRHFRPAMEPTTISKNKQLRLDAAVMVVGLSWSWAPLQNGLGHDVPESMIARRKAAQVQAYALPRSHLMHGTDEVWRQLGAWFLE